VTDPRKWVIHGERLVDDTPHVRVSLADAELPNQVRFTRYVFRVRRCAMTVVLDDAGERVLMMRRHRFIMDRWVWELPGGRLDCAAAVGDLVLFLAGHLGVGAVARVGVGDEDGVVAEAGGAAGLGGEGAGEYLDAAGVGVAERGGDGGAAVGESCGHVQDAVGADGVEEPGDEGAGQAVPGVDGQAGVVDRDGLAELRAGVGDLAGGGDGGVGGLDLGLARPWRGDVGAGHGGVLGRLAGVPGDEGDAVEYRCSFGRGGLRPGGFGSCGLTGGGSCGCGW
jgi:hypothetical protein